MLLSDCLNKFLFYLEHRKRRSPSTITTYRPILQALLKYTGDIPVEDLTRQLLNEYADILALRDPKPKTLRNKLSTVRSFIAYLYIEDLTIVKPEQIELPKEEAEEANFLTPEETDQLLNVITDVRDKAMIHFMVRSGVRVNELAQMRLHDVYKCSVVVRKGKGSKNRVTYITKECEEDLKRYIRQRRGNTPGYLFPNPMGQSLSRAIIARKVKFYALKAGIEKDVTPHTLRHTFATTLLMNGARIEDVQQLMGHSSIRTTQIYLHFTNEYLAGRYVHFMEKPTWSMSPAMDKPTPVC